MKHLKVKDFVPLAIIAFIISIILNVYAYSIIKTSRISGISPFKHKIIWCQKKRQTIPEEYKNISIEQIKSQVEITEYKTIKGAATTAGTESMSSGRGASLVPDAKNAAVKDESDKNIKDREALKSYANTIISLEGQIDSKVPHPSAPLAIEEPKPGKYQIWFCDKTRKPCRYQAFLLYEGPEGKGENLFTKDTVIKFWGVILDEEIRKLSYGGGINYKRYPKIRVIDLEVIE